MGKSLRDQLVERKLVGEYAAQMAAEESHQKLAASCKTRVGWARVTRDFREVIVEHRRRRDPVGVAEVVAEFGRQVAAK